MGRDSGDMGRLQRDEARVPEDLRLQQRLREIDDELAQTEDPTFDQKEAERRRARRAMLEQERDGVTRKLAGEDDSGPAVTPAPAPDEDMPLIRIGHVDEFRPKVESVIDDFRPPAYWRAPTAREAAVAAGGFIMAGLLMATALSHLVAGGAPAVATPAPAAATSAPTAAATAQGTKLPTAVSAGYRCTGGAIKLFDNWNGSGVQGGGTPVTFSTSGNPYCLAMVATYHWNGGKGALPGRITIAGASGSTTTQAVGTNGQNDVPDANWVASFPPGTEPLINGTYTCGDSEAATWAQNDASSHLGFCRVWVSQAVPAGAASAPPAAGGGTTTAAPSVPRATPSIAPSPASSVATRTSSAPSASAVAVGAATPENGPLPWYALVFVGGAGLVSTAGWLVRQLREAGVDCAELRKRCTDARAAAQAARQRADTARARAASAKGAYDQAKAAREQAAKAAAAAEHPDEGRSWIEDSDTHERITEHDLALERAAGGDRWGDPAARAERRAQEKQHAHEALDAAQKAEDSAHRAADQASAAAAAADTEAKTADDAADHACLAADECEMEQARMRAQAKAEEERRLKGAMTPPPAPSAGPTPPTIATAPPSPAPVTTPPVAPPVAPATPMTQTRHECDDGDEPRVDVVEKDFRLYLLWAAKYEQVVGTLRFTQDDVDAALAGFKKFKTVADIATFIGGFASGAGNTAVGDLNIDAVLNVFTTGMDRVSDAMDQPSFIDPSGAAGWGVEKALDKLITLVEPKRFIGYWTISVPLVAVHAKCTRTFECQGGRWVLTDHQFELTYVRKIADVPGQKERDNSDQTDPARGLRSVRWYLAHNFDMLNRPVMAEIKAMTARCAAR